ncbi:MAG: phage baseplate assembly protein V [Caldilineales bacterium]
MGLFAVPPVGANVWIEFEAGDPDYPIWAGGFKGEALLQPAMLTTVMLRTGAVTPHADDLRAGLARWRSTRRPARARSSYRPRASP